MPYDSVIGSALMGLGVLAVLRAVIIVMRNETGRFPFDPAVSIVIGFALILLGQSLL